MNLMTMTPSGLFISDKTFKQTKKSKSVAISNKKRELDKDRERSLSRTQKKKIINRIHSFYQLCINRKIQKVTFYTLTLTSQQKHKDSHINKMLNNWFTLIRTKYNKVNYLWVAEKQENQNIHYHIIFTRPFNITILNYWWVQLLKKNGYETKEVTKKSSKGGSNPVDAEHVYNVRTLSAYLCKYITKNKDAIQAQIWNCSTFFSKLSFRAEYLFDNNLLQNIIKYNKYNYKGKLFTSELYRIEKDGFKIGEYLSIVNINCFPAYKKLLYEINKHLEIYL